MAEQPRGLGAGPLGAPAVCRGSTRSRARSHAPRARSHARDRTVASINRIYRYVCTSARLHGLGEYLGVHCVPVVPSNAHGFGLSIRRLMKLGSRIHNSKKRYSCPSSEQMEGRLAPIHQALGFGLAAPPLTCRIGSVYYEGGVPERRVARSTTDGSRLTMRAHAQRLPEYFAFRLGSTRT